MKEQNGSVQQVPPAEKLMLDEKELEACRKLHTQINQLNAEIGTIERRKARAIQACQNSEGQLDNLLKQKLAINGFVGRQPHVDLATGEIKIL
jgi:hypothetical protein